MTNETIEKVASLLDQTAEEITKLKTEVAKYKSEPVKNKINKLAENYRAITGEELRDNIKVAMENNEELCNTIASVVGGVDDEKIGNMELKKEARKMSPRETFDEYLSQPTGGQI